MSRARENGETGEADRPSGRARRAPDARSVETALRTELAGFEVRSRDVELSASWPGLRADWVGADRDGRRVWATLRDGPDEAAILWAVDAVACARSTKARDRDVPALVVLIVTRSSPRLFAALSFLPRGSVALFETAAATGGGRGKTALIRRDPHAEAGVEASSSEPLERWPAAARSLAEGLAARMRRVDPALDRATDAAGLRWSWHGEVCAALSVRGGSLVGISDVGAEPRPIEDDLAAETWLGHVVRAHGARLRRLAGRPRTLDVLARGRPLLTAEELAAFRDD